MTRCRTCRIELGEGEVERCRAHVLSGVDNHVPADTLSDPPFRTTFEPKCRCDRPGHGCDVHGITGEVAGPQPNVHEQLAAARAQVAELTRERYEAAEWTAAYVRTAETLAGEGAKERASLRDEVAELTRAVEEAQRRSDRYLRESNDLGAERDEWKAAAVDLQRQLKALDEDGEANEERLVHERDAARAEREDAVGLLRRLVEWWAFCEASGQPGKVQLAIRQDALSLLSRADAQAREDTQEETHVAPDHAREGEGRVDRDGGAGGDPVRGGRGGVAAVVGVPPAAPSGDSSPRADVWDGEWCKRCDRRNVIGFDLPDDVWNAVVRGRWNVLCPTCFDEEAQASGVRYGWGALWPTTWRMDAPAAPPEEVTGCALTAGCGFQAGHETRHPCGTPLDAAPPEEGARTREFKLKHGASEDELRTALRLVLNGTHRMLIPPRPDDHDLLLHGAIEELVALRARLREVEAAIRKHRSAVWGDGEVQHDEDVELYAALDGRTEP